MADRQSDKFLDQQQDALVSRYVMEVTVPLLADGPKILGTGTLFTHEGRHFIVTAAHIFKVDPNDPGSEGILLTDVAVPDGRESATIFTLGSFDIHRPDRSSRVDVMVLELKDQATIAKLESGWRFLEFDSVGQFPFNARFILSGYPFEGHNWDGENLGQNFLKLSTDPLPFVPNVDFPEPSVDRFFHLEKDGQLLDGSTRKIPRLQGLSGASLWAYSEPSGIWSASVALKVVAVQSSAKHGEWIRCADWDAVRYIFRKPQIGFLSPP